MTKTFSPRGKRAIGFKADVPAHRAPMIDSEEIVGGIRMYICGKAQYIADTYDRLFLPKKGAVKSKSFKGLTNVKLKMN